MKLFLLEGPGIDCCITDSIAVSDSFPALSGMDFLHTTLMDPFLTAFVQGNLSESLLHFSQHFGSLSFSILTPLRAGRLLSLEPTVTGYPVHPSFKVPSNWHRRFSVAVHSCVALLGQGSPAPEDKSSLSFDLHAEVFACKANVKFLGLDKVTALLLLSLLWLLFVESHRFGDLKTNKSKYMGISRVKIDLL